MMTSVDRYARASARILWHGVRLPTLLFLVVLEPIVRFLLWGLALQDGAAGIGSGDSSAIRG
jgi:hypothetical protein